MILDKLEFPEKSVINQFLPKKIFYEHGNFNQRQINIFTNNIKKLTLLSQLLRSNTLIDEYADEERTYKRIDVIFVEFKKVNQIDQTIQLIMNSIPFPIILIGQYKNEYSFFGAHQRDNQIDESKIILDKIYSTEFLNINDSFIQTFNYKELSKSNLYTFYDDYIQKIMKYRLEKHNIKEVINAEAVLQEVEAMEEKISKLKNKLKKERHFNKKMDINIRIKNLEIKLQNMEEEND